MNVSIILETQLKKYSTPRRNPINSFARRRLQKVSGPRLFLSFPRKRESMASYRPWTLASARVTREEASEKSGHPAFDSFFRNTVPREGIEPSFTP